METSAVISFILNGLMGIVMFYIKTLSDRTKEDIRDLQDKQDDFQEKYQKKEDFKEFKEDLWKRFDDLKIEIRSMGNR